MHHRHAAAKRTHVLGSQLDLFVYVVRIQLARLLHSSSTMLLVTLKLSTKVTSGPQQIVQTRHVSPGPAVEGRNSILTITSDENFTFSTSCVAPRWLIFRENRLRVFLRSPSPFLALDPPSLPSVPSLSISFHFSLPQCPPFPRSPLPSSSLSSLPVCLPLLPLLPSFSACHAAAPRCISSFPFSHCFLLR